MAAYCLCTCPILSGFRFAHEVCCDALEQSCRGNGFDQVIVHSGRLTPEALASHAQCRDSDYRSPPLQTFLHFANPPRGFVPIHFWHLTIH